MNDFAFRAMPRLLPCVALAALGLAPCAAQDEPPDAPVRPPDAPVRQVEAITFEALLEQVRTAHRPTAAGQPLDRFHATLRYTPARVQEDSVELDLDVTYLEPGFLRYRVEEPGQTLEKGFDENGAWSLVGKQLNRLQGKTHATDRAHVKRDLGIARQLLRLLDPAAVLARLESPSAPLRSRFKLSDENHAEVWVVRGRVAEFPLHTPGPDGATTAPAILQVTIDAKSGLLHAIESQPLDQAGAASGPKEGVVLRDMVEHDGLVLPRELFLYRNRERQARVGIRAIDLAPDAVTPATVRRPG